VTPNAAVLCHSYSCDVLSDEVGIDNYEIQFFFLFYFSRFPLTLSLAQTVCGWAKWVLACAVCVVLSVKNAIKQAAKLFMSCVCTRHRPSPHSRDTPGSRTQVEHCTRRFDIIRDLELAICCCDAGYTKTELVERNEKWNWLNCDSSWAGCRCESSPSLTVGKAVTTDGSIPWTLRSTCEPIEQLLTQYRTRTQRS
jgi:hypothetical protein